MAALLGITLPELLGTPPGVLHILPASALRFIRQLSLVPTAAGVADGAVVHSGFAQLPDALVDLGVVELLIPGLERGLPFRFFNQRPPQAAGGQTEAHSGHGVLQIARPEFFVPLPFEPGIFVAETTTTPAFLKRFP